MKEDKRSYKKHPPKKRKQQELKPKVSNVTMVDYPAPLLNSKLVPTSLYKDVGVRYGHLKGI